MSQEFMRKYPKTKDCPYCGKMCSVKGIKQHKRRCKEKGRT